MLSFQDEFMAFVNKIELYFFKKLQDDIWLNF